MGDIVGCAKCDVDYCTRCVSNPDLGMARIGERLKAECMICCDEKTNCGKWCSKCQNIICQDCWSRIVLKGCPYCNDGDGSHKINRVTGNFLGSPMDLEKMQKARELHAHLKEAGNYEATSLQPFQDLKADSPITQMWVRRTAELIASTAFDELHVFCQRIFSDWANMKDGEHAPDKIITLLLDYQTHIVRHGLPGGAELVESIAIPTLRPVMEEIRRPSITESAQPEAIEQLKSGILTPAASVSGDATLRAATSSPQRSKALQEVTEDERPSAEDISRRRL